MKNLIDALESEAIYILRECVAQSKNQALLFSGGKDSIALVHLSLKAFGPSLPFPLLHVDTGHNFPEVIRFRDEFVIKNGLKLIVAQVEDTIRQGKVKDETGPRASRNVLQTRTLLDAIREYELDAVIGGARRDEEKARAKERFFSFRNTEGKWDPLRQQPELWWIMNGSVNPGEHVRVFPLSDWTELDVWRYIAREKIALPSIYYAHDRRCLNLSDGTILALAPFVVGAPGDVETSSRVRCRTVGDMTCTGLMRSEASTAEEVIAEIESSPFSERGSRFDDRRSDTAMENRKRDGYF